MKHGFLAKPSNAANLMLTQAAKKRPKPKPAPLQSEPVVSRPSPYSFEIPMEIQKFFDTHKPSAKLLPDQMVMDNRAGKMDDGGNDVSAPEIFEPGNVVSAPEHIDLGKLVVMFLVYLKWLQPKVCLLMMLDPVSILPGSSPLIQSNKFQHGSKSCQNISAPMLSASDPNLEHPLGFGPISRPVLESRPTVPS